MTAEFITQASMQAERMAKWLRENPQDTRQSALADIDEVLAFALRSAKHFVKNWVIKQPELF